ncbi:MAG: hypothetical protein KDH20_14240 [Rhodocyclaceae bacterium]|nr:hypothetical protein [Rhodocyclaceae bacterium]
MGLRNKAELLALLVATVAAALPAEVRAQVFCCDNNGQQVCADVLPPACYGKAYRVLSPQGVLIEAVEAPLTPDQLREKQQADRLKRREQDRIRSERLRERALLETYRDLEDIDRIEERAIAEIEIDLARARKREAELMEEQAKLKREQEFYQSAPMPEALNRSISDNLQEILAQRSVIESKQSLIQALRERYEADRKAYKAILERRATIMRR